MKVGIAIDAWKLPIFTRHLKEAGIGFTNSGVVANDCLMLHVIRDTQADVDALADVCRAANTEAAALQAH